MSTLRLPVSLLDRLRTWIDDLTVAPAAVPEDGSDPVTPMSYAEILAASAFLDFGGIGIDSLRVRRRDDGSDHIRW